MFNTKAHKNTKTHSVFKSSIGEFQPAKFLDINWEAVALEFPPNAKKCSN